MLCRYVTLNDITHTTQLSLEILRGGLSRTIDIDVIIIIIIITLVKREFSPRQQMRYKQTVLNMNVLSCRLMLCSTGLRISRLTDS